MTENQHMVYSYRDAVNEVVSSMVEKYGECVRELATHRANKMIEILDQHATVMVSAIAAECFRVAAKKMSQEN